MWAGVMNIRGNKRKVGSDWEGIDSIAAHGEIHVPRVCAEAGVRFAAIVTAGAPKYKYYFWSARSSCSVREQAGEFEEAALLHRRTCACNSLVSIR